MPTQTPYGDAYRTALAAIQIPPAGMDLKSRAILNRRHVCETIAACSPEDLDPAQQDRWAVVTREVLAPAVEGAQARYAARSADFHSLARVCAVTSILLLLLGVLAFKYAITASAVLAVAALASARTPAEILRIDLLRIGRLADQLGVRLLLEASSAVLGEDPRGHLDEPAEHGALEARDRGEVLPGQHLPVQAPAAAHRG